MAKLALGMNGIMIQVFLGIFLVATKRLYKSVCPSVGPLVGPWVGPSVCNAFAFRPSRSDECRVYGLVFFEIRFRIFSRDEATL